MTVKRAGKKVELQGAQETRVDIHYSPPSIYITSRWTEEGQERAVTITLPATVRGQIVRLLSSAR